MTSADVVYHLRRLLNTKKVGHTGTLDPGASGVLPICVGQATRVAEYLTNQGKVYQAEMTLGVCTTTQDRDGEILSSAQPQLIQADLLRILPDFTGEIEQVPPMFSAVRVKGKHLYEYARAGQEIERCPRQACIYTLRLKQWTQGAFPKALLDIECSKGTYIRTLCYDIGQALGCGAYMSDLLRVKSGPFEIAQSWTLERLQSALDKGDRSFISHVSQGLDLPLIALPAARVRAFCSGLSSDTRWIQAPEIVDGAHVQVTHDEELLGIGIWQGNALYPHKVMKQI
jgi:tRNA pseudouridine55 synthase